MNDGEFPPGPPAHDPEDELEAGAVGLQLVTPGGASPKSPAEEQVDALARKIMELEKKVADTQQEVKAAPSDEKTIDQGGVPMGVIFLGLWLVAMLVCFAAFTDYSNDLFDATASANQMRKYGHFQDVHVMIFIGFGFLMTFLRRYGLSAVSFNMMIAVYAILWHILVNGFMHCLFHNSWNKITLNLESFILGDFGAACVLITFGALLGKVTYQQLMIVTFFEIIFFSANENMNIKWFMTSDIGGSVVLHTFGAYFGLAASWVLTDREKAKDHKDNEASYNSDIFAMIGTIFLFMFWPSFNSALASDSQQQRTVVNTLTSIIASSCSAFLTSYWANQAKFSMVDIQNATLAGGVAIGTASNMALEPGGAMATGLCAGFLSVVGYAKITKWLEENCGVYDTCGVHNLHGMPGILAGIAGTITAATASADKYKGAGATAVGQSNMEGVFGGRFEGTCCGGTCVAPAVCTEVRTAASQAGFQILYLAVTLFVSIITGLLTGYIAKCAQPATENFEDSEAIKVGDEEHIPAWGHKIISIMAANQMNLDILKEESKEE
jgi:ammonium transporter Rh